MEIKDVRSAKCYEQCLWAESFKAFAKLQALYKKDEPNIYAELRTENILRDFQTATNKFRALKDKNGNINLKSHDYSDFKHFMKSTPALSKFTSDFKEKSHFQIRNKYRHIIKRSCEDLNSIDPNILQSEPFSKLKPNIFGVNIKKPQASKKKTKYVGKKVAAYLLAAGMVLGTADAISYATQYNDVNIYNAQTQGYDLNHLSQETLNSITNTRNLINTLKTSDSMPTSEQIDEIKDLLDINLDLIFSDLVIDAVKREKKDWKDITVDTSFDDNLAKNGTAPNKVTIQYTDKNGEKKSKEISNLNNANFFKSMVQTFDGKQTTFNESFDIERDFDLKERTYTKLYSKAFNSTNNFEDKSDAIYKILDFLESKQNSIEIIAAKQAVLKDGIMFDKLYLDLLEDTRNSNDDLER